MICEIINHRFVLCIDTIHTGTMYCYLIDKIQPKYHTWYGVFLNSCMYDTW